MTDFQPKSGQNGLGAAVAETELGETGGGRISIPVVPWQAKALMSAAWVAGVTALASGLFRIVPIGIVCFA